jgi:hypothetical protein
VNHSSDAKLPIGLTRSRVPSSTNLSVYAVAPKLVFSATTLGAGFLGGELTPLFFVGAALLPSLCGCQLLNFANASWATNSRIVKSTPERTDSDLVRDHGHFFENFSAAANFEIRSRIATDRVELRFEGGP